VINAIRDKVKHLVLNLVTDKQTSINENKHLTCLPVNKWQTYTITIAGLTLTSA